MRILFIAPSAYLLGGVQDWMYMTVIGLRKRGHVVEVGVPDGFYHNGKMFNKHFAGIDASFFRNRSGTNEGRIRGLKRFIEKREIDIIVGVNIGNLFETIARLDKDRHAKFVLTVHAIEHNYFADIEHYKKMIDGVIVTNKLAELLANKLGRIENSKIHYAPYGVSQKEVNDNQTLSATPLMIAWVGRLEETQKRASDIKEVLKSLDRLGVDYKLGIAGDGPDKERLLAQISEWLQAGKVHYHGMIEKEKLKHFYKGYHILLITSTWETGPIVAWEAINSGLVVVSSKYIGSKAEKSLQHEKTALMFDIGDAADAAKQIARLTDENLRYKISYSAKTVVTLKYSVEASLDAWEKAFIEVISSKRQSEESEDKREYKPYATGRLEKYFGLVASEFIRSILPNKIANSAGDEWPHSLQGVKDQSWILNYAKELEEYS